MNTIEIIAYLEITYINVAYLTLTDFFLYHTSKVMINENFVHMKNDLIYIFVWISFICPYV